MRQGAIIAYKGEKATLIVAGSDIKKQRQTYRELANKARHDKGYDRIEWYVVPHKTVRRRPEVSVYTPPPDSDSQAPAGGTGVITDPNTQAPADGTGVITDPNTQAPAGGTGLNTNPNTQLPLDGI